MPLYRYERIPAGRKNIFRGITLSWAGNRLAITADIEVSGTHATEDRAAAIKATIERYWNVSFDEGYQVSCHINIALRAPDAAKTPGLAEIIINNDSGPSNVDSSPGKDVVLNYHISSNIDWVPAHEFGHMLDLRDHYDETFISTHFRWLGAKRDVKTQNGWQGNLMAEHGKPLEKKNLQEIISIHCLKLVTIADDFAAGVNSRLKTLDRRITGLYR